MYKVKRFSLIQREFGNKENKLLKNKFELQQIGSDYNEAVNKNAATQLNISRKGMDRELIDDGKYTQEQLQKYRQKTRQVTGNVNGTGQNAVNNSINMRGQAQSQGVISGQNLNNKSYYTDAQRAEARRRIAERKAKEAAEKAKSSISNPTPTPNPSVPTTPSPTTPKPKVGKFKLGKGGKIALGTAAAAAAIYGTKKAYDMTVGKRKNN